METTLENFKYSMLAKYSCRWHSGEREGQLQAMFPYQLNRSGRGSLQRLVVISMKILDDFIRLLVKMEMRARRCLELVVTGKTITERLSTGLWDRRRYTHLLFSAQ